MNDKLRTKPPKAGTTPSPLDLKKGCEFCATPIYIQIKRVYKSVLAPCTRAGELRAQLEDLTGEAYIPIEKNYCPVCGKKLGGKRK